MLHTFLVLNFVIKISKNFISCVRKIFISQTFYSVMISKKVKRFKNEALKTGVCDSSFIIIKILLRTELSKTVMVENDLRTGKINT